MADDKVSYNVYILIIRGEDDSGWIQGELEMSSIPQNQVFIFASILGSE